MCGTQKQESPENEFDRETNEKKNSKRWKGKYTIELRRVITKFALAMKTLERLAEDLNSSSSNLLFTLFSLALYFMWSLSCTNDQALLTFRKIPLKSSAFVFIQRSDSLGSLKSTLPFR